MAAEVLEVLIIRCIGTRATLGVAHCDNALPALAGAASGMGCDGGGGMPDPGRLRGWQQLLGEVG
jgi:hypothetical protein